MVVRETLIDWKEYSCGANGQIYSYYFKRYLSGCVGKRGYVVVCLKCVDGKRRHFYWHRIIWTFFYGTIPQDMQINHIDENKQNNALSNLNLMTAKENSNWGTHNERVAASKKGIPRPDVIERNKKLCSKPVVAYNDDGEIVHEFESMMEAERHGFKQSAISACCRGKLKHHGGYGWRHP